MFKVVKKGKKAFPVLWKRSFLEYGSTKKIKNLCTPTINFIIWRSPLQKTHMQSLKRSSAESPELVFKVRLLCNRSSFQIPYKQLGILLIIDVIKTGDSFSKSRFCCSPWNSGWFLNVLRMQWFYRTPTGRTGPSFQRETPFLNQTEQGPSSPHPPLCPLQMLAPRHKKEKDAGPTCSAPTQGPFLASGLPRISSRRSGPGGRTQEPPCQATECSDTGSQPVRSDDPWDCPSDPGRKAEREVFKQTVGILD